MGYELAIKGWQAETHAHLLAARLVRHPDMAEAIKKELRQAVEKLVQIQMEETAYQVQRLEAELEQARRRYKEIESHRQELAEERMKSLLQAIEQQRSSRQEQSPPNPKNEVKP